MLLKLCRNTATFKKHEELYMRSLQNGTHGEITLMNTTNKHIGRCGRYLL